MVLDRLRAEHRQVLRVMDRIQTALFSDEGGGVVRIGEARFETQHILRDHFAFKDAFVFRIIAASDRPGTAVTGRRLRAQGQAIAEAYHAHLERWDPSNMAASWTAYRDASLEMIRRLRDLVERERRYLYPLLEAEMVASHPESTSFLGRRTAVG